MPVPVSRPDLACTSRIHLEVQRLVARTYRITGADLLASAPLLRCGLRGAAMECAAAVRLAGRAPTAAVKELGTARGALGAYRRVLYVALRNHRLSSAEFDELHGHCTRLGALLTEAQRVRLAGADAPAVAPEPGATRGPGSTAPPVEAFGRPREPREPPPRRAVQASGRPRRFASEEPTRAFVRLPEASLDRPTRTMPVAAGRPEPPRPKGA